MFDLGNITVCDESDQYKGANPHTLRFAGKYMGETKVIKFSFNSF
jgi:hypothetical protein